MKTGAEMVRWKVSRAMALCAAALIALPALGGKSGSSSGGGARASVSVSRSAAPTSKPSTSVAKASPSVAAKPIVSIKTAGGATTQSQPVTYKSEHASQKGGMPSVQGAGAVPSWGSSSVKGVMPETKYGAVKTTMRRDEAKATTNEPARKLIQASPPKMNVDGIGVPAIATAERAQAFSREFRDVRVETKPTTSVWTWVFLAWALHNSAHSSDLERDNAALKERMAKLEGELKSNPDQWAQAQEIARSKGVGSWPSERESEPQEKASEAVAEGKRMPAYEPEVTRTNVMDSDQFTKAMAGMFSGVSLIAAIGIAGLMGMRLFKR